MDNHRYFIREDYGEDCYLSKDVQSRCLVTWSMFDNSTWYSKLNSMELEPLENDD